MIRSDSQKRFSAMPEVMPTPGDTALIIIDMQYGNVHPDYGVGKTAKEAGRLDIMKHLYERLPMITANIKRLQTACRNNRIEVIFIKMQSYTKDGRELSPGYKLKGFHWPPGTRESEIIEDLKPKGDEIVLNKLSTSAFATTPIDQILRYMKIKKLLVVGVNTNYCVETFVREACDKGYEVILVEDGCATLVEQHHQTTCEEVNDIFCKVKSTDQMIQAIGGG